MIKKEEKKDLKKEAILHGAADCFTKFGYEKTTLDDIGKSAALNKASIYYYFKNKEEIFSAVALHEAETYIEELQSKTNRKRGLESKIIFYVTERIKKYNEVVTLHRLSLSNVNGVETVFNELYRAIKEREIQFIQSLLEKGLDNKEITTNLDLYDISTNLFVISDALKYEALRTKKARYKGDIDVANVPQKIAFFIRLILKGLSCSNEKK
jgi:AcrR family transcriptional regulator